MLSEEQLQAIKAYADGFEAAMDQVSKEMRRWSQRDEVRSAFRSINRLAWLLRPAPWPNRRSKRARRRSPVAGQSVRVIDRKGRAHWRHSPNK